jgi:ornithine cyclodeaminase/alanine dehydrogenase
VSRSLLYLSRSDVEAVGLEMPDIIQALERMFGEKGEGGVEMPPKPGIHPGPDSFLHAMPAWIPSLRSAGIKWVSAYPDNPRRGLPYVAGLVVLNDPDTGLPLAVMDATWITAKRTGAASALAARYLARPESSSLGILACGVQGRSHLEAFAAVFELDRVVAYDVDADVARRYADEMHDVAGVEIAVVDHPRAAVEGLDLVVTSGPILKEPHATIEAGWLEEGAFAAAVDFDSYWSGAALREIDRLVTDDVEQMAYYRELGYFGETPPPDADLGDVVAGSSAGRTHPGQRTMAMHLGLAADDMATAILLYERARKLGIGRDLEL